MGVRAGAGAAARAGAQRLAGAPRAHARGSRSRAGKAAAQRHEDSRARAAARAPAVARVLSIAASCKGEPRARAPAGGGAGGGAPQARAARARAPVRAGENRNRLITENSLSFEVGLLMTLLCSGPRTFGSAAVLPPPSAMPFSWAHGRCTTKCSSPVGTTMSLRDLPNLLALQLMCVHNFSTSKPPPQRPCIAIHGRFPRRAGRILHPCPACSSSAYRVPFLAISIVSCLPLRPPVLVSLMFIAEALAEA